MRNAYSSKKLIKKSLTDHFLRNLANLKINYGITTCVIFKLFHWNQRFFQFAKVAYIHWRFCLCCAYLFFDISGNFQYFMELPLQKLAHYLISKLAKFEKKWKTRFPTTFFPTGGHFAKRCYIAPKTNFWTLISPRRLRVQAIWRHQIKGLEEYNTIKKHTKCLKFLAYKHC